MKTRIICAGFELELTFPNRTSEVEAVTHAIVNATMEWGKRWGQREALLLLSHRNRRHMLPLSTHPNPKPATRANRRARVRAVVEKLLA